MALAAALLVLLAQPVSAQVGDLPAPIVDPAAAPVVDPVAAPVADPAAPVVDPAAQPENVPALGGATIRDVVVARVLAEGAYYEILLPDQKRDELGTLNGELRFFAPSGWLAESWCDATGEQVQRFGDALFGRRSVLDPTTGDEGTVLILRIPPPPCPFPSFQDAWLTVFSTQSAGTPVQLLNEPVRVSVKWISWAMTIIVVALVYPLIALIAWFVRNRRSRTNVQTRAAANPFQTAPSPNAPGETDESRAAARADTFLAALDPVQITANAYGRGSLAKLQIFFFTLIVFALLLYHQFASGILADLSADVMWLLGISALGAVGGKLVHRAKRRLSFENWTWLRTNGWLPKEAEKRHRARWGDLFIDYDNQEFDIYSFQMAVFSVVVGVALLGTSLQGLGTFEISENLLILLGISQGVFLVGRGVGTSSFQELDAQITKVIALERKESKTPAELVTLEAEVRRAAEMFIAAYGQDLGGVPAPLWEISALAKQEVASGTTAVFPPETWPSTGSEPSGAGGATGATGAAAGGAPAGAGGTVATTGPTGATAPTGATGAAGATAGSAETGAGGPAAGSGAPGDAAATASQRRKRTSE